MKKAALIILAALFVAACTEETPIVKPIKTAARATPTPRPQNQEFRAVEKPSSYAPEEQ